jgi:hypothetical protein
MLWILEYCLIKNVANAMQPLVYYLCMSGGLGADRTGATWPSSLRSLLWREETDRQNALFRTPDGKLPFPAKTFSSGSRHLRRDEQGLRLHCQPSLHLRISRGFRINFMSFKQVVGTPPPGKKARTDLPVSRNERASSPQFSPVKLENEDQDGAKDEGNRRR